MNRYDKYPYKRDQSAKYNKNYYNRTAFSVNHRKPWEIDEERLVMEHEMTDTEIAEKLGRSVGSIQKHRWHMKNMEVRNIGCE